MPVQTTTDDLTPGMKLHSPAHDGRTLMMPAGKSLNTADIDFLRTRIPGVTVYVEDPVLDQLVGFHNDAPDIEVAAATQRKLVSLTQEVQRSYASRLTTKVIDCGGIKTTIAGVLSFLRERHVQSTTLLETRDDDYLAMHTAHVFYLSLMMGNVVRARINQACRLSPGRYAAGTEDLDLTPLALAALFMDLAMVPLSGLFTQTEPLTLEQCEGVRNHPVASAAALGDDVPDLTRLIIETHHENYDGSGYPYGLKGEEIHILSRILRINDAYSAATTKHAYREACSDVRALWEMCWGTFKQFYDPILLKIFSSLIQPFPIGAKLRLNTGQYGVVVRYGKVSPFLPEIVIAFDPDNRRLKPNEIVGPVRLQTDGDVRIAAFGDEDLTDIYAESTVLEPATLAEFTTIFESMYTGVAAPTPR